MVALDLPGELLATRMRGRVYRAVGRSERTLMLDQGKMFHSAPQRLSVVLVLEGDHLQPRNRVQRRPSPHHDDPSTSVALY
jgi:hypothetical protein